MLNTKKLYPVIHHLDQETSLSQGCLALSNGADGIFLISHHGSDSDLVNPALTLKEMFPEKDIGINFLSSSAISALQTVINLNLDMVWVDAPGITSWQISPMAMDCQDIIRNHRSTVNPNFNMFGSVAFKYQPEDLNPGAAALKTKDMPMIPTTSGDRTGSPPTISKISSMSHAINKSELAVASGMTPENVKEYLPYLSHFLVATGIALDEYHIDLDKMLKFLEAIKNTPIDNRT